MAGQPVEVFEEHLGVIDALKENYMRNDDAITIANINMLRQQVAQLCRAREDEVKEAIKELVQQVHEAEREATYPEPEDAHKQKVTELEVATSVAREGVEHLTAQLQALEAQRVKVKSDLADLEKQQKDLENIITTVVPSLRHKLSLYAHISKIQWDFKHTNRISGIIDDPKSMKLEKFDLGEDVSFASVNALWELIESKPK